MKKYIKSRSDDFSNQDRKWYVASDLQGSDFGMYRLYTADEWLDQACEWCESDGVFDKDYTEQEYREYWENIIKNNPQDFIDYVADLWELRLVEHGVDGHDFYKEFPEEDTPYGYF